MKRSTTIFYFLFALINLNGQEPKKKKDSLAYTLDNLVISSAPTYTFINYNENKIYYGKDSSVFMNLYRKMENLQKTKNNQIKIVHIGGSHVQGGTWSNTFLQNFTDRFNAKGSGYFVFPYKLAKTNGQPYANSFSHGKWTKCRNVTKGFCLPLGMNGWSVSTNDSADYFGIVLTKYAVNNGFNVIKVYHNFNPSFEIQSLAKSNKTDFKELGFTEFKFDTIRDSVAFTVNKIDTLQRDFTLYGFSLEDFSTPGYYLAGLGANGASTNSFLRCNYFVPQLATLKPDLVVLSLGVNDVQAKNFTKKSFKASYDSLIYLIKNAAPECAIILTTTTDNYIRRRYANKRTEIAREAAFEIMESNKDVAVWDMFKLMGGYKSIVKWNKKGLAAKDKVHFSPKGYRLLGELMFEAIYKSYLYNTNTTIK